MKRIILVIALLAFSLAGCTKPEDTGAWTQDNATITVKNNGGGNIASFLLERRKLAKSGKIVRIEGYCASACTVFYSLPNACLAKGSSLHFHGAANPVSALNGIGDAQMSAHYRAGIKKAFDAEWHKLTKPLHKLTREQAKALDPGVKFCEE